MRQTNGKRKRLQIKAMELMADGMSISETARTLRIDRSTLHRWLKAPTFSERAEKKAAESPKTEATAVAGHSTPSEFEVWVRSKCILTAADEQLLALATQALQIAQDNSVQENYRLQAMGRFQALLKDIRMRESKDSAESPKEPARTVSPSGTGRSDPRGILKAVESN